MHWEYSQAEGTRTAMTMMTKLDLEIRWKMMAWMGLEVAEAVMAWEGPLAGQQEMKCEYIPLLLQEHPQ